MSTSVTLDTLHQRIVRDLYPGRFPLIATTTGSVGAGVLTIAATTHATGSSNAYDGAWVYVPSVTAVPKQSRVQRGGFTVGSGLFAMTPNYGSSPANAKSVYFTYGLAMSEIDEAINEILRGLYLPRFLPWGINADGDMEGSTATDWAAVGSPGTRAKSTTARKLLGKQVLHLATTSSDEGAQNTVRYVTEGTQLLVSAGVALDAGSLRVQLYDATNAAEIDGVTVDESAYTEVRFIATVPDNCQSVRIRLLSKTATTTAYINWAVLQPVGADLMDINASGTLWEVPAHDFMGVWASPPGHTSEAAQSYEAFTQRFQFFSKTTPRQDYHASNGHWLEIGRPVGVDPLWVEFRAPASTLSQNTDDTNTTPVPEALIVSGALAELKRTLAGRSSGEQARKYLFEAGQHGREYRNLLNAHGLGKPVVTQAVQQRVPVVG